MKFFSFDTPERVDEPEWIDSEEPPYEDFRASMSDVRRANRFLGGTYVVTRQVRQWMRSRNEISDPKDPILFLDVATGSADLPEAILTIAQQEHRQARVIGLDFSRPILKFAQEMVGGNPDIRLVRGDAFRLPFADASMDYVLCSLAFHHFGPVQCVAALREMERVARHGWLVNDLRRARSAWILIRAISKLTRMNRLTQHDGPASVLRAYSLNEYRAMPRALGLRVGQEVILRRHLFYRVALIREKSFSSGVPEP